TPEDGGGFSNLLPLPDGRLAVFLGGISGQGSARVLLNPPLAVHARQSLLTEDDLGCVLARLNNAILGEFGGRSATAVVGVLDPGRHTLILASAGYPSPLRYRHATWEVIPVLTSGDIGPSLGRQSEWQGRTQQVVLAPGDCLLVSSKRFTDGE